MTDDEPLEVSIHVAAEPETVFRYFTDPARYRQWMGTDVDLDPVPGGVYRVRMRDGVEALGEFVEVVPPHRIVFTWGWTAVPTVRPGSSRVVVTLEPEPGGTRLVLRHHGLPDADERRQHGLGWRTYLGRLQVRLSGGDPGPDPNASA
jgi:uncharacterized protein YndB with AHSA1/START domain